MIEEIKADAAARMRKTIESLQNDFLTIRTGRASPALVEKLSVEYYGQPTPLQQLAAVSVPEAQMLLIRPYAATDIPDIEKAIAKSDLGLTPSNDGQQIRLVLPALTEERRRELTRVVGKRAEEARVAVRNIRRDSINDLREFEKEGMISEDERHRGQDEVQEVTNTFIDEVDQVKKAKEEEIMKI
ncbi:ribosome recycling factor [Chloroflexi bacterium TSY]|nr:ribosome recycling factor [Chloroflexi bacterium TSY]